MRHLVRSLAPTVAACLVLAVQSLSAQEAGIAVGAMVPAMTAIPTLDGGTFDLSTVAGKRPVVIEFWATWCPLCKKLEPAMADARAKYGDRVSFIHVGVPENQTPERQAAFIKDRGLTGTFLFDRDHVAMKAFAVPHTSYLVVLDATGKVSYTGVGGEQDVDAAVRLALPGR